MNLWILILINCFLVGTTLNTKFAVNRPSNGLSNFKIERFDRFMLILSVNQDNEIELTAYDGDTNKASKTKLGGKASTFSTTTYLDFAVWHNEMAVLDTSNGVTTVLYYILRPHSKGLEVFKSRSVDLPSSATDELAVGAKIVSSKEGQAVFLHRISKSTSEILGFRVLTIENGQPTEPASAKNCLNPTAKQPQILFNTKIFVACLTPTGNTDYILTVGHVSNGQFTFTTSQIDYSDNMILSLFHNPVTNYPEVHLVTDKIQVYRFTSVNLTKALDNHTFSLDLDTRAVERSIPLPKMQGIELYFPDSVVRIFYKYDDSAVGTIEETVETSRNNNIVWRDQVKFGSDKANLAVIQEPNDYIVYMDTNYCLRDSACSGVQDVFECPAGHWFHRDRCYEMDGNKVITSDSTVCAALSTIEGDLQECGRVCLNNQYYSEDGKCVEECSAYPGYYSVENKCLTECSERFVYDSLLCHSACIYTVDGSKCNNRCESGIFKHSRSSICTSACPTLTTEEYCRKDCSAGYFDLFSLKCEKECANFIDNGVCRPSCGENRVVLLKDTIKYCQNDCNLSEKREENCLLQCSSGLFGDIESMNCLENCSEVSRLNNKTNYTCVTTCGALFRYKDDCVETCPFGLKSGSLTDCKECSLTQENQCVDKCDRNRGVNKLNECLLCSEKDRLGFNNTCVSVCPSGYGVKEDYCEECVLEGKVSKNGVCVDSCGKGYGLGEQNTCQTCEQLSKLVQNGECVSECTDNYGNKGVSCLDCREIGEVNQNNMCQTACNTYFVADSSGICRECIETNKYYYSNACFDQCPPNTITNGKHICIHCAENNLVSQNGKCEEECAPLYLPDTSRICQNCAFFLKLEENDKCVDQCAYGSAEIEGKCQICSRMNKLYYNKACLDSCPPGTEAVGDGSCKTCREIGKFAFEGKCLTNCPRYYVSSDDNACITCKSKGKRYFDSRCVDECPLTTRDVDFICSDCSSGNGVLENNKCVDKCSEGRTTDRSNQCVTCKEANLKEYRGDCVSDCPANHISNDSVCTPCSGSTPFYFESSCVRECPSDYSASDLGICKECINLGKVNSNGDCLEHCPPKETPNKAGYCHKCINLGMFLFKEECYSECPSNTISTKNECKKCKEVLMFEFNSKCVFSCPAGHESLEAECVPCTQVKKVEYQGKCYSDCPPKTILDKANKCVPCSYLGMKLLKTKCVTACPKEYKESSGICTPIRPDCSDLECLPQCEQGLSRDKYGTCHPCSYFNMVVENGTCLKECSEGKEKVNNHCVSCDKPNFYFEGECVKECIFNQIEGDRANLCLKCPEFTMFYDGNCLGSCPENTVPDFNKAVCLAVAPCQCLNGVCKEGKCVCSKGYIGSSCETLVEDANLDLMIAGLFSPFSDYDRTTDMSQIVQILNLTENSLNSRQIGTFEMMLGSFLIR